MCGNGSHLQRHRELCGGIQAYIFDSLAHTPKYEEEDRFRERFGDCFGLSFTWINTDRKPQFLFLVNGVYSWKSMNRSNVARVSMKPLAEKNIYHGKLVSQFSKRRGGQKKKHPLKLVCEDWAASAFATSVNIAVQKETIASSRVEAIQKTMLQKHKWAASEDVIRFICILHYHYNLVVDKALVSDLKKHFLLPAKQDIQSTIKTFMHRKWTPIQMSTSLQERIKRAAAVHFAEGTLIAGRQLNMEQLVNVLRAFSLSQEQLLVIAEQLCPLSSTSTLSQSSLTVFVGALLLHIDAIFHSESGGHRLPLSKTIITKYNRICSLGNVAAHCGLERTNRANLPPEPEPELSVRTAKMEGVHAKEKTKNVVDRSIFTDQGIGVDDGGSIGTHGVGAMVAPKLPPADGPTVVYYEILDDWNTGLAVLEKKLWRMIEITGTTPVKAGAAPSTPTLPTAVKFDIHGLREGMFSVGAGETQPRVNVPPALTSSDRRLGVGMAAGPRTGGNIIDVCLSTADMIKMARQGFDGLSTAKSLQPTMHSYKCEPLVEATCFFTFPAIGSTDGAETQTIPAQILGFVDGSCNFGFRCVVPECPYVSSEPDITMLAQVHVQAWITRNGSTAVGRSTCSPSGMTRKGSGSVLRSDSAEDALFVEDTNVSGGYLYLGKEHTQRAQDTLLFIQEVYALGGKFRVSRARLPKRKLCQERFDSEDVVVAADHAAAALGDHAAEVEVADAARDTPTPKGAGSPRRRRKLTGRLSLEPCRSRGPRPPPLA
jgi:hypothetical protein